MSEQVFTSLTNGGPVSVYVREGKVVRVRPLAVDESELKPWHRTLVLSTFQNGRDDRARYSIDFWRCLES